jgi:[ribosomal protein S18]-alanine N-acetyltransferase
VTSCHPQAVRIEPLCAADEAALADFFEEIAADAETVRFFHPHPLTRHHAGRLCAAATKCKDKYWLARQEGTLVGYSMLRGWEEGYAIPSFGGCVRTAARGLGLGHLLLAHAIEEARAAGARRLRLSVCRANQRAIHLYDKFGFVFENKNPHELVGWLDLDETPASQLPGKHLAGRVSA